MFEVFEAKLANMDNQEATAWEFFLLTCVQYPTGDALGKVMAAASLLPFVFVAVHFALWLPLR